MGTGVSFVQADIDDYWAGLQKKDARSGVSKQESKSTKDRRKAALGFYLNEHLNLGINMKKLKTTSKR